MRTNIRYPAITGPTARESLEQVKSYLSQLADQLNLALSQADRALSQVREEAVAAAGAPASPSATFNAIKALIIKSADIVESYTQTIEKKLQGVYVAQSDFGTFTEQTVQELSVNSTAISQLYTDVQDIYSTVRQSIDVTAHIKSGLLYYDAAGAPVFGVEIGQKTRDNTGAEVFNKFARFTAHRLIFYDSNGIEVAYISDKKLYITQMQLVSGLTLGGFQQEALPGGGTVTKWIGG